MIDCGHGLREFVQRWNNALVEFRKASRENLNTSPATTGQATIVDNYIPVSTTWDLETYW